MGEGGVFGEDDRVELLDGHIYDMSPIGSEHAACVRRLDRLFQREVGSRAIVSIQNPVRLNEASEPEPDLALLAPREDNYAARHPRPDDVLLVVEVADTSLPFDREVKRSLYAQAGIPELWIVNLEADRIEVYRTPQETEYTAEQHYERDQSTSPQHLSEGVPIAVNDVLGPQ
jgi:Uma2 family endonuclease